MGNGWYRSMCSDRHGVEMALTVSEPAASFDSASNYNF